MSDFAMADIRDRMKIDTTGKRAEHSTSSKAGKGLEMDDFLMLMVATLKNQSIDDTADTSDMLNQMVQMSMITAMNNISSLVTESTSLSYAASLVGKYVTVGVYEKDGKLKEIYGEVTGTGTLNGKQVIFMGDDIYFLSDVMAVGKLPASDEDKAKGDGETDGTGGTGGTGSAGGTGGTGGADGTDGTDGTDGVDGTDGTDDTDSTGDTDGTGNNDDSYDGSDGVDT